MLDQLKPNVLKWNSLHTSSAVMLQACSSLTFSSVPAFRIPQSSLNFHRSKNRSVLAFCIPWQILLFPYFKTKAQLDTTQLRCCCPRNNLGKVGLDFSSAGTTFCGFWRHCLCQNPSWEEEQPSPEGRGVWLMLYRYKQGSVMLGVEDKVFICSLPSNKPTLLISGSPSLVGFQESPLEMRTFPFHHYVEVNHIPFLSRGISMLLLGHVPWKGIG